MKVTDTMNATRQSEQKKPPSQDLGKEDFLRLLTTQLAQQDPLSPMDNQAFVAQLSQLATVERLENVSQSLETMALAQAANTSAQVVSFIGQKVLVQTDSFDVQDGEHQSFGFELASAADVVEVTIRDADGKVVRTIEAGAHEAGRHEVGWDGLDQHGNPVADGSYTFSVSAKNDREPVAATTHTTNVVRGITYKSGFPELLFANEKTARLGEIIEVVEQP